MFWLCLRSPCADPSSKTTNAAEGGGRIPARRPIQRRRRPRPRRTIPVPSRRPPPRSWQSWRWMPRETRRSTRGRRTRPAVAARLAAATVAVPRRAAGHVRDRGRPSLRRVSGGGYGEGKRGCGHHRTNAPRRRHCSLRRFRSAGSLRPARPPPRNGGRGGGAAVDADAVATAEASVAVAVIDGRTMRWRCPRGRDSAPLPTEGALDGATAPTTERPPPFRWCRHHPPRRRRRETMRRPLTSSSSRRSPMADEGKALGLDRNDDKRTTDDSGRKASDATADDNNSSAISAARMS